MTADDKSVTATPDWRGLCEELSKALCGYDLGRRDAALVLRVSAALAAEPVADGPAVPEGREPASVAWEPSDEELLATLDKATADFPPRHPKAESLDAVEYPLALELRKARAVLARYGHQPAPAAETDAILALAAIIREVDGNHSLGAAALAEAILSHRDSRWGQQPAPPAAGEVGELVAWLRDRAESTSLAHNALRITRAADLLERQAAPVLEPALARINDILNDSGRILQTDEREALELARQALEQRQAAPVPVNERLPGPGDCDAEGRFWAWCKATKEWCLLNRWHYREESERNAPGWASGWPYWLPATALPLPSGEVE